MKRFSQRLTLEILEDRRLLATCHVVRLGDFGAGGDLGGGHSRGDLRYCINKANDLPGPDTIDINATGTINLTAALPGLNTDMDIAGPGPSALTVRRNTGGNYRIFAVAPGANVHISGLHILNGLVQNDVGGGILNRGNLTLDEIRVTGNTATNAGVYKYVKGGGIYNEGTLTISRGTIASNTSRNEQPSNGSWPEAYGGGIYNASGTLNISDSALDDNFVYASGWYAADAAGGGLYNLNGTVTLVRSTVADNYVYAGGCDFGGLGAGGGIGGGGFLSVVDSTIFSNFTYGDACGDTGYGDAGGIGHSGTVSLTNSTVVGNDTHSQGWGNGVGGIHTSGTWTITHSTIAGNEGGIEIDGSLTLRNSVVQDVQGQISSSGYNLIINSSFGSGYVPSDILDVDPKLGNLANNGGPTLTIALLPGSPAIDSGTNQGAPEWDQRGPGFPRIVNGTIDRGAFEVQATGTPLPWHDFAVLITANLETEAE